MNFSEILQYRQPTQRELKADPSLRATWVIYGYKCLKCNEVLVKNESLELHKNLCGLTPEQRREFRKQKGLEKKSSSNNTKKMISSKNTKAKGQTCQYK